MKSLALCLVAVLLAGAVQAQDTETLQRRLQSVATLIETSSAARQIEASGDAAARDKRENARRMHREAAALLGKGDAAAAAHRLDEAALEMMNGVRLARPEQLSAAKDRRDFDARMDSARALLAAQQRITQEKGNQPEAVQATQRIQALIGEAQRQAAAGQVGAARPLVDRAYLSARVSIESMRRGDTLVRSLQFASPREEYDYEVDRNDTHRMLIQVLLADRQDSAAPMRGFIDAAADLRRQAEAAAGRGEFTDAIRHLEASTRELVRAIRVGGIYIPG